VQLVQPEFALLKGAFLCILLESETFLTVVFAKAFIVGASHVFDVGVAVSLVVFHHNFFGPVNGLIPVAY